MSKLTEVLANLQANYNQAAAKAREAEELRIKYLGALEVMTELVNEEKQMDQLSTTAEEYADVIEATRAVQG